MAKLFDVSIDYLTITEKNQAKWNEIVSTLERFVFPAMLANGHTWDSTKALGYVGSRLGTIFTGSRSDSSMLRVSGQDAQTVFQELRIRHTELHVTRIDLQCTVAFEQDVMLYAETLKGQALHHQGQEKGRTHPRITLISTSGNGDTLQVGARSSEVFCRVYDKWREQKMNFEPFTWRFEVECKGTAADKAVRALRNSENILGDIQNIVDGTFTSRGIIEPALRGMRPHTLTSERASTDDEKKLRWLASHVRGTVKRLIDHGYKDDVLDSLGLVSV